MNNFGGGTGNCSSFKQKIKLFKNSESDTVYVLNQLIKQLEPHKLKHMKNLLKDMKTLKKNIKKFRKSRDPTQTKDEIDQYTYMLFGGEVSNLMEEMYHKLCILKTLFGKKNKVVICKKSQLKKYTKRPSPPFPAVPCKGKTKKGNDGNKWKSEKRGNNYRWYKVTSFGKKRKSTSIVLNYRGMWRKKLKPLTKMTKDELIKDTRKFALAWERITSRNQDMPLSRLKSMSVLKLRQILRWYYSKEAKTLAEEWLK
jgi:hypothetical protein